MSGGAKQQCDRALGRAGDAVRRDDGRTEERAGLDREGS